MIRCTSIAAPMTRCDNGSRSSIPSPFNRFLSPIVFSASLCLCGSSLQGPAARLFALDCFEERLEVSLAEAAGAVAFDHFEEQRRPIFHRLGEDLQQIA